MFHDESGARGRPRILLVRYMALESESEHINVIIATPSNAAKPITLVLPGPWTCYESTRSDISNMSEQGRVDG